MYTTRHSKECSGWIVVSNRLHDTDVCVSQYGIPENSDLAYTVWLPWRRQELRGYLEVMNSMRVLTFPSCSTERSTSPRRVAWRCEMAALLFPKLILEEVELELSPESVIGEGW